MTPLRRRMIEDMRIRNLSPHTQRAYVEQVSRFARHFGRPPELLGPDEIRSWQIYLVEERRLAASSISVAAAALRFVYAVTLKKPWIVEDDIPTSRQPKKLPEVVPSPEEVARFLAAVGSPKHRMILTVCYATGLRISEAVSLKPAAIDSQRMVNRETVPAHGRSVDRDRQFRVVPLRQRILARPRLAVAIDDRRVRADRRQRRLHRDRPNPGRRVVSGVRRGDVESNRVRGPDRPAHLRLFLGAERRDRQRPVRHLDRLAQRQGRTGVALSAVVLTVIVARSWRSSSTSNCILFSHVATSECNETRTVATLERTMCDHFSDSDGRTARHIAIAFP